MSLGIDYNSCRGCRMDIEAPCVRVCPGDLLYQGSDGRVVLRSASYCWDCAACVKACPRRALYLSLPLTLGGRGARLFAHSFRNHTEWLIILPSGEERHLLTPAVQVR